MTQRRLFGLLIKKESTYGTDAVPVVGTDGLRLFEAFEPQIEHVFPNRREDTPAGTLGRAIPAPMRGRVGTFTFVAHLYGAGAAYDGTNLRVAPLVECCGYSRATDTTPGSETDTFTPADANHAGATLYYYWGGKLFKAVGCRGTARILATPGEQIRIAATLQGLITSITEVSLPTIVYGSVLAPAAEQIDLTIGALTVSKYESLEYDLGTEVERSDGNVVDGVVSFDVAEHIPVFRVSTRTVPISSYDPWTDARAATARAIDCSLGGTQYNQVDIACPAAYVEDPAHTDQRRHTGLDLEFHNPFEAGGARPTIQFV